MYLEQSGNGIGRDAPVGIGNEGFKIDIARSDSLGLGESKSCEGSGGSKLENRLG
jgi:hypothetical protein